MVAQGQHVVAQGQHMAAQGMHMAAQSGIWLHRANIQFHIVDIADIVNHVNIGDAALCCYSAALCV